jgi:single-strand DNA-binding protein
LNDSLSTRGLVATVPNHIVTTEGLPITSFRLAAAQRRFNRSTQTWETSDTNWYTVTAFRQLAINIAACVAKGDRIVVSGRLSIRDWESGDRTGTVVEIDADAVGHDLTWGTSTYSRTMKRSEPADEQPAGSPTAGSPEATDGSPEAITQSAWGEAELPAPTGGLLSTPDGDESDDDSGPDADAVLELQLDDSDDLTVAAGTAP